jgi:sigma-B regulation protein RsbU (phosphoserine phosphatase)
LRALSSVVEGEVRLWRVSAGALQLVAGEPLAPDEPTPSIPSEHVSGPVVTALPGAPDYYYQWDRADDDPELGALLARLLDAERETMQVADELARRYEEIHLLYTISEVLGRTIDLKEAANVIVREVSAVVGARRASILVHHPETAELWVVAGWGIDVSDFEPVSVDDESSIAASAFRKCDAILGDAKSGNGVAGSLDRTYRGHAFLSVPIVYPDSGGTPRPVGVINLTDRMEEDAFRDAHVQLVTAVAHQIGAAIENARLVVLDQQQRRVRRELELAHDLQLRLLPAPTVLKAGVDVGAKFRPAESVGGDFYQFVRLPRSQVGIMLGDVSSHGFSAALVMALVLSAAAIHAVAAKSPETALERLLASVKAELAETEMHLALFYGVADAKHGQLKYANAGHPHAFRVPRDGPPERLEATVPPLGLGDFDEMVGARVTWERGNDLLLLFSDGITEARSEGGELFGEARVIDVVRKTCTQPAERIVEAVFEEVDAFCPARTDDQTVVVLKA